MSYYETELVEMFFNRKLDEGHHKLVYNLSGYWGSGQGLGRRLGFYIASYDIQERLIHEFGYQRCPSCLWAMTEQHTGWCAGQQ